MPRKKHHGHSRSHANPPVQQARRWRESRMAAAGAPGGAKRRHALLLPAASGSPRPCHLCVCSRWPADANRREQGGRRAGAARPGLWCPRPGAAPAVWPWTAPRRRRSAVTVIPAAHQWFITPIVTGMRAARRIVTCRRDMYRGQELDRRHMIALGQLGQLGQLSCGVRALLLPRRLVTNLVLPRTSH